MILHDWGSGHERFILLGTNELLGGLARAKLWLADGTFKLVPYIFFNCTPYTFRTDTGNSSYCYCLAQQKTRQV